MVFYTPGPDPGHARRRRCSGVTGPVYFVAALVLGLAFLGFAIMCVVTRQRADARQVFLASILYLPCLLAAMMLDKV